MEKTATVYLIRNCKNNKVYIGSTRRGSEFRWKEEVQALVSGKHKNKQFVTDWNSTAKNDWQFIELEKNIPVRLQFAVEQLYLDKYQSFLPEIGYNINKKSRWIIRSAEDFVIKNEKLIKDVVEALKNRVTYREISKKFGISTGTISNIRRELLKDLSPKRIKNYGLKKTQISKVKKVKTNRVVSLERIDEIIKNLKSGDFRNIDIANKYRITESQVFAIKKDYAPENIRKGIGEEEKKKILKLKRDGMSYRQIQKETKISVGSICNICASNSAAEFLLPMQNVAGSNPA